MVLFLLLFFSLKQNINLKKWLIFTFHCYAHKSPVRAYYYQYFRLSNWFSFEFIIKQLFTYHLNLILSIRCTTASYSWTLIAALLLSIRKKGRVQYWQISNWILDDNNKYANYSHQIWGVAKQHLIFENELYIEKICFFTSQRKKYNVHRGR